MYKLVLMTGVLMSMCVSMASAQSLNQICEWRTRGIVAAAPCMTQFYRDQAADNVAMGYGTVASMQRALALRIQVIADKLKAGEITEAHASGELVVTVNTSVAQINAQADADYENERRRLIQAYKSRNLSRAFGDAARDLQRTWTLQGLAHPNCSQWGVC